MQPLPDQIYYGPVLSRLDTGLAIYKEFGAILLDDSHFLQLFSQLREGGSAVNEYMAGMNLGPLCSRCSTAPNGGCCSLAMAGETDALQICMNLLAGVEVQPVRDDGNECVFLGKTGCIFLFKPIFCLNYNCTHIHRAATAAEMAELERRTGTLLTRQYAVEQYILARIQQAGSRQTEG